jgi:hypothetical protein
MSEALNNIYGMLKASILQTEKGIEPMAKQIPLEKLVKGRHYVGRGRNGNIGKWDGERFLVISYKFNEHVVKLEPYYTEESGCFQPFLEIDEGKMMEPFGKDGWDAHYGKRIEFGKDPA